MEKRKHRVIYSGREKQHMSIYSRGVDLLNQIHTWLSGDTTSVVTFMCHCTCTGHVQFLSSTEEARQWLEEHRDHYEPLIDVRWEGIHPKEKAGPPPSSANRNFSGGYNRRMMILEKIHKLYQLAENTSFPHEARAAKKKIRILQEQLNPV